MSYDVFLYTDILSWKKKKKIRAKEIKERIKKRKGGPRVRLMDT